MPPAMLERVSCKARDRARPNTPSSVTSEVALMPSCPMQVVSRMK